MTKVIELMKMLMMSMVVAMMMTPANVSAQTLLANISPDEFAAKYQNFIRHMSNFYGSIAAMDYSKYLIKNQWQDTEHNQYVMNINEDYDNGKMNRIVIIGGNSAYDKQIYYLLVVIEDNFENLMDSFKLEITIPLYVLGIKDFDKDRLKRIIDDLDAEYTFYSSQVDKNIRIVKGRKENTSSNFGETAIIISAY